MVECQNRFFHLSHSPQLLLHCHKASCKLTVQGCIASAESPICSTWDGKSKLRCNHKSSHENFHTSAPVNIDKDSLSKISEAWYLIRNSKLFNFVQQFILQLHVSLNLEVRDSKQFQHFNWTRSSAFRMCVFLVRPSNASSCSCSDYWAVHRPAIKHAKSRLWK